MTDNLTPQQAQAVRDRGGKLLVSAAAGSGKTKVLVDRLMSYLTDPHDPANLDEFLIITYTRAAASELRSKIAARLTEYIAQNPENRHLQRQMQRLYLTKISTVHSFCSDILREYAYRIDLPTDFRMGDEAECDQLRRDVLKDLLKRTYENPDSVEGFREFVDSQSVGRNDNAAPEIVLKVYNSARCHRDPDSWLSQCLSGIDTEGIADAADTVWGRYLMDDLFAWLDCQLAALQDCLSRLKQSDSEGKVTACIADLVIHLEQLRSCTSWDEVVRRKDISFGTFPKSKKNIDPQLVAEVKAVREACKEELKHRVKCFSNDSEQVLRDLRRCGVAARGLVALVRSFDREYTRAKRNQRILDFGDLEHRMLDLLLGKNRSGRTSAAEEIAKRFREIMVDEYQDTNEVQDAIFEVLTEQRRNCFMVGDVKQSIYRFRLADPNIFLEKYRSYVPAENARPMEGRKILLSRNFRSGGDVISGINDVFYTCMSPEVGGLQYGPDEALQEGVPHTPMPDSAIELHVLEIKDGESYEKEAAFTAKRIRTMLQEGTVIRSGDGFRPVSEEDIVILLRSPSSSANVFLRAMEAEGIRCALERGTNLMDTEEIITFRAFLKTISNPRQDIPLLGVLAGPLFGFTADDLAAFRSGNRYECIYDALLKSRSRKAEAFLEVLNCLRRKARTETLTELLKSCMNLTGMDSIFGAMPGGKARQENLRSFYRMAADYEQTSTRTLDQFLDHLESRKAGDSDPAEGSTAGSVTITSIHKSKGLEYPVVFLCGLSHKFNLSDVREQVLCDKDLGLGLMVADQENRVRYSSVAKRAISVSLQAQSVSEELRVLYVAMTRAKDRLVMTCTMKNPEKKLKEIASRLSSDGGKLLCMEADSSSEWVLTAAMQRIEAGALHNVGGRPAILKSDDFPWKIDLVQTDTAEKPTSNLPEAKPEFGEVDPNLLRRGLEFSYPYLPATMAPSKQTATGRKGRARDDEAAEDAGSPEQPQRIWREPSFCMDARRAAEYGTVNHNAMQYLRYERCTDPEATAAEVASLTERGLLTPEQAGMVNVPAIAAFFESEPGRKLRSGAAHIREFKFSVLDDGSRYGSGLEGEKVLLQGVVDCAILEEDGITVIDFKTDRITEETLPAAVERHRMQLETYADALTRIYEKPVKEKCLYFFCLSRGVSL